MSRNFNTNTKNNGEWLTPQWLTTALGEFDLDPCSPINRPWPTATAHYTELDNGLTLPWSGRVWCNPPYGKETFVWLKKLAEHRNGIALIFARTETKGFHSEVWNKADGVFFFEGRIKFHYVTGEPGDEANAPSCLVSYNEYNTRSIFTAESKGLLRGVLIRL